METVSPGNTQAVEYNIFVECSLGGLVSGEHRLQPLSITVTATVSLGDGEIMQTAHFVTITPFHSSVAPVDRISLVYSFI